MKTDVTLWESVGTGETVTITAPADAKLITLRVLLPGGASATCAIKVVGCRGQTMTGSSSDEFSTEKEIGIFPNPVRDQIEIVNVRPEDRISLLDTQGRVLKEQTGTATAILDMQALPAGLYLVSVSNHHHKQYFKIVKL